MLIPDPGVGRLRRLRLDHPVIGSPGGGVGRVPLPAGQRVDRAETRHIEGAAESRHNPGAVGELACRLDAGAEAKAEIVLAQGTRCAAEWVDVAADRAAIADKLLFEVLPVIEPIGAHHDPDLEMAPGLIDTAGAD